MRRLLNVIAVLAVGGIVVSSVSLQHHFATSKTAYCDIGTAFNCDIVNRSSYSSIMGIPVALIGLLGYGTGFWDWLPCIEGGGKRRRGFSREPWPASRLRCI
jgi:uncharacterized membrane protein